MAKLTDTLRTDYYDFYKHLSKVYRFFLEDVAFKFYSRPDIAIRCAAAAEPPTPELVISYYYQGLLLIGRDIEGGFNWQSYPSRAVITPETARISRRLKQYIRKEKFDIRINTRFEQVVRSCQRTEEKTWINEPIIQLYNRLHEMGYAASLEAYRDGELVGGIWGLGIGRTWSIMSMFHNANRAGSILLGTLVQYLKSGELDLVDCGLMNENFRRYGAYWMSIQDFRAAVVRGTDLCANDLSGMAGFDGITTSGRPTGAARSSEVTLEGNDVLNHGNRQDSRVLNRENQQAGGAFKQGNQQIQREGADDKKSRKRSAAAPQKGHIQPASGGQR